MPGDLAFKCLNGFHRSVMRLTFGRLGWKAGGMTVIELTTTGRRSGLPRTCLLTSPLKMEGGHVVVASRGGDARHPDWFSNLQADPRVTVSIGGGPQRSARARIATPEERVELWPRIVARYRNYAAYQARTGREIPAVLLEVD